MAIIWAVVKRRPCQLLVVKDFTDCEHSLSQLPPQGTVEQYHSLLSALLPCSQACPLGCALIEYQARQAQQTVATFLDNTAAPGAIHVNALTDWP